MKIDLRRKLPNWAAQASAALSERTVVERNRWFFHSGGRSSAYVFNFEFGESNVIRQFNKIKRSFSVKNTPKYVSLLLDQIIKDIRKSLTESLVKTVQLALSTGGQEFTLAKRSAGLNVLFYARRGSGFAGARKFRPSNKIRVNRVTHDPDYHGFTVTYAENTVAATVPTGGYKPPMPGVSSRKNPKLPQYRTRGDETGSHNPAAAIEYGDAVFQRRNLSSFRGELSNKTYTHGAHAFEGTLQKNIKILNRYYSEAIYDIFNRKAIITYKGKKYSLPTFIKKVAEDEILDLINKDIERNKKSGLQPKAFKNTIKTSQHKRVQSMVGNLFGRNSKNYKYLSSDIADKILKANNKNYIAKSSIDTPGIKNAIKSAEGNILKYSNINNPLLNFDEER